MRILFLLCTVLIVAGEQVSIEGLDKPTLLRALWDSSTVARFYGGGTGPVFDDAGVASALDSYVDYYSGRAIKMHLNRPTVESHLYDRDATKSARLVIESVRSGVYRKPAVNSMQTCRGCGYVKTAERLHGYPVCADCKRMFEKEPELFQMVLMQPRNDEL